MRKRSIILIATVLSVGIIGGAAAYYRHHHGPGHDNYASHFTKHIERKLTKKLTLNETQKAGLGQLTQSLMTSRQSFKEQRIFDLNEIFSLLEADQLDQEKALNLVRERLAMIESHAEQMISSAAGFTDSLTGEQRAKLKEMIEQRMSKRRHHRNQE